MTTAVPTPHTVTGLPGTLGKDWWNHLHSEEVSCSPALLNTAEVSVLCKNLKQVSSGKYLGNEGCEHQPGCIVLQLLLVSQQLSGTPSVEFSCSRDLALQHLFSVTILSGCQNAHREHRQEKGNSDFYWLHFI